MSIYKILATLKPFDSWCYGWLLWCDGWKLGASFSNQLFSPFSTFQYASSENAWVRKSRKTQSHCECVINSTLWSIHWLIRSSNDVNTFFKLAILFPCMLSLCHHKKIISIAWVCKFTAAFTHPTKPSWIPNFVKSPSATFWTVFFSSMEPMFGPTPSIQDLPRQTRGKRQSGLSVWAYSSDCYLRFNTIFTYFLIQFVQIARIKFFTRAK